MRLLNIRKGEKFSLGIQTDQGVLDVEEAGKYFEQQYAANVDEVVQVGEKSLQTLYELFDRLQTNEQNESLYLTEGSFQYGPCITNPGKILCVGLNYKKHAEEANMPLPNSPVLFSKFNNSLAAHQDSIKIPETSENMDYEVELVIVIGKKAHKISVENALSYVFGYCTGNDLSARDLQFKTGQWLLGKICDGFAPIGPYVVSADEIPDPNNLHLECKVNGETRQSSNTKDMIFNCSSIINYVSHHMTLYPGDIIFTGTPQGVISGYPESERQWLKAGDVVTASIEKLGQLQIALI